MYAFMLYFAIILNKLHEFITSYISFKTHPLMKVEQVPSHKIISRCNNNENKE